MTSALPIRDVKRPMCLLGQQNGRIPDTLLESIPGQDGGPTIRLVEPAARAWKAMQAAALADGVVLKATSTVDSFRPYAVQERIFRQRYTTTPLRGRPSREWEGVRWYQKPGTAAAAVPGTSNHGWALAVDNVLAPGTLAWLLDHALSYGWSWELQSEPWHVRYFAGDDIPAAVLDHEHATPSPAPPPHPIIEEDDVFTYRDARDNRVWIVEAGQRRKVERPELGAYIAAGVLKEPKTLTAEQADVMVWNYPEKK